MEDNDEQKKRSLRALGALNKVWDSQSSHQEAQDAPQGIPVNRSEENVPEEKKAADFWESALVAQEESPSKIPKGIKGADFFGEPPAPAPAQYQYERPEEVKGPSALPDAELEKRQEVSKDETESLPEAERSDPQTQGVRPSSGKTKMSPEEKKAYWESLSDEQKRKVRERHKAKKLKLEQERKQQSGWAGAWSTLKKSVLKRKQGSQTTQGSGGETLPQAEHPRKKEPSVQRQEFLEEKKGRSEKRVGFKTKNPLLYKVLIGVGGVGSVLSVLMIYVGFLSYKIDQTTPGHPLYVQKEMKKTQKERTRLEEQLRQPLDEEGNLIEAPSEQLLAELKTKNPQELIGSLSDESMSVFERQTRFWQGYQNCQMSVKRKYQGQMGQLMNSAASVVAVRGALNYETASCALEEPDESIALGAMDLQSTIEVGTAQAIAQADALRLNALSEKISQMSQKAQRYVQAQSEKEIEKLSAPYADQIAWCQKPLGMMVCRYKFMTSTQNIASYGSGFPIALPVEKQRARVVWQLQNPQEYAAFMQRVEEALMKNESVPQDVPWESAE